MKKKMLLTVLTMFVISLTFSITVSAARQTSLPITMAEKGYSYNDVVRIDSFDITSVQNLSGKYQNRIYYSLGYSDVKGYATIVLNCYDAMGMPVAAVQINRFMSYVDVPDVTATIELTVEKPAENSDSYFYCKYMNVHAYNGATMAITDLQLPVYKLVGWYEPVTMYALDGRTIEVSPFQTSAYESVGWYSPVKLYKNTGEEISVSPFEIEYYQENGWETAQVMYSYDGRTIEVPPYDAEKYNQVGWYYPETMFSIDGRTIEISPFQVAEYQSVGWYTAAGYIYYTVQQLYNENKAAGDYYANIYLANEADEYLAGTIYESSVDAIRKEAMAYLLKHTVGPLYYVDSDITKNEYSVDVNISLCNVSNKKVIAFKSTFDIYDVFGSKMQNPYEVYYSDDADLDCGETMTYIWELYDDDIKYIKNFRITEVVYSDGTKWVR